MPDETLGEVDGFERNVADTERIPAQFERGVFDKRSGLELRVALAVLHENEVVITHELVGVVGRLKGDRALLARQSRRDDVELEGLCTAADAEELEA